MKILLVNPPFLLSKESPYSKTGAVLPPLGLLYIAAYLRKFQPEHEIHVLDGPAYRMDITEFENKLSAFEPDVVGITIYTPTYHVSMQSVEIIKKKYPKCVIVAGGPHASVLPDECINSPFIDIVVKGEGEITFNNLIEKLTKKEGLTGISNIVYKENNQIIHSAVKYEQLDLNSLPMPARDLVDLKMYKPAKGTYRRLPCLNMITSRGCPFKCGYCSKSIFGSNFRALSAEKTIEEIEFMVKEYGVREIYFNDDVFTMDLKRTEQICRLLIDRKIDITWGCSTRVNLVNPVLLKKMKESGCVSIGYGIESGDPEILKSIDKDMSLAKALEAIEWTKKAGIETRAFYIFGFPGENKASINRTFEMSLKINADFVIYNLAIPIPGTEMYEKAKKTGKLLYDGEELYKRTDGTNPLVSISDMTESELKGFYKIAYSKYYLRPAYILKRLSEIKSFDDIKRNISGFLSFVG